MNIEQIIHDKQVLEETLINALSTMERKDTIKQARLQLLKLQSECPHHSAQYNWQIINNTCPYCGKKLE